MRSIEENFHEWSRLTVPVIIQSNDKPQFAAELHRSFTSIDQKIAKQFAMATFFADHRKELLDFEKPVLILQSRNDTMSPLHVGDYLHAHLKKSWLKILNADGHYPQLTAPEELVKAISPFIREQTLSQLTNRSDNA